MKTYRKFDMLPSCRLTKADLVRLAKLVTEHVTEQGWMKFDVKIGDATIEASTLDAFLAHEELPHFLDNLRINGYMPDLYITVHLGGITNSMSVEGDNEVKVRGSFERLHDFLHARRRLHPPRLLASGLLVSTAVGTLLTLVVQILIQGALIYGLVTSIAGAYLLLRYITWTFFPLRSSAQVWLAEKPTFWRGIFTRDNLSMAIAALALVFTIIQTLK